MNESNERNFGGQRSEIPYLSTFEKSVIQTNSVTIKTHLSCSLRDYPSDIDFMREFSQKNLLSFSRFCKHFRDSWDNLQDSRREMIGQVIWHQYACLRIIICVRDLSTNRARSPIRIHTHKCPLYALTTIEFRTETNLSFHCCGCWWPSSNMGIFFLSYFRSYETSSLFIFIDISTRQGRLNSSYQLLYQIIRRGECETR